MSITEHLARLEAIAGKATPGEWDVRGLIGMTVCTKSGPIADCHQQWTSGQECKANAAFIALARTELPKLCAALKAYNDFVEGLIFGEAKDRTNEASDMQNRIVAILGEQQETKL